MFGDATTLPFPDDSFDLVLAIEALEHVPRPEAALTELARVCSGTFIGSVPFEPIWRAGNNVAPPALRPPVRQHARPRQPLDPLGLSPGSSPPAFHVQQVRSPLPWTMVRAIPAP